MSTPTSSLFPDNYGWDSRFYTQIPNDTPRLARIIACDRGRYRCALAESIVHARPPHEDATAPATGDWVILEEGDMPRIRQILPRKTTLSRRDPGKGNAVQTIAVNCEQVLVMLSAEEGLRSSKALRLFRAGLDSGATPSLLLSKADLRPDAELLAAGYRSLLPGIEVIPFSARTGAGMELLHALLIPGTTAVLIGASGCGKSTLLNRLLGTEEQQTAAVRDRDRQGRHTTVSRTLFPLPGGSSLIDTPGIREWALCGEAAGEDEIDALATGCRFRNCSHTAEPGCAVLEAVRERILPVEVYRNCLKLREEREELAIRRDPRRRRKQEREQTKHYRSVGSLKKKLRNKK